MNNQCFSIKGEEKQESKEEVKSPDSRLHVLRYGVIMGRSMYFPPTYLCF